VNRTAQGLLILVLLAAASMLPDSAHATDGIHLNGHYWDQWAYAPATAVNAYDCVTQNQGIQTAANKWNATGLVSITTLVDNCNTSANGIVWRPKTGTTGCDSYVVNDGSTLQGGVLDPDLVTAGTLSMDYHATIYLGPGCPADGQTTCAGYYSPCDVPTHELGHALGLGDHYTHDSGGNPLCTTVNLTPTADCFSYKELNGVYNPNGTPVAAIMDYPHIANLAYHDTGDATRLYRLAPFNEYPVNPSALNFHRVNITWGDRSHNETNHMVEERPYAGSYAFAGSTGKNGTSLAKDVSSPGYNYCYRLRPLNSWSTFGAYTGDYCVNTPHAVQNVAGAFGGGSNFGLCWNVAASGSGVTSYRVLRQRYNNGSVVNTIYTVSANTSCYGSVLFSGSTAYADWHHFAVRGCDAAGVCSPYWDMKSPNYYWVYMPCSGNNANCSYSGSPTSWYHAH
jgi:hypothetical protein